MLIGVLLLINRQPSLGSNMQSGSLSIGHLLSRKCKICFNEWAVTASKDKWNHDVPSIVFFFTHLWDNSFFLLYHRFQNPSMVVGPLLKSKLQFRSNIFMSSINFFHILYLTQIVILLQQGQNRYVFRVFLLWYIKGSHKKRSFYSQADRKGGGVSPLGPDRKQMWKFWSNFSHYKMVK